MSYTGNIWNNVNNSGHSDSGKTETAADIKKTSEDSHGNQESAQMLQSPAVFFQPKQQKRRDRAALKKITITQSQKYI